VALNTINPKPDLNHILRKSRNKMTEKKRKGNFISGFNVENFITIIQEMTFKTRKKKKSKSTFLFEIFWKTFNSAEGV
jgi:hypothetical protein